MAARTLGVLRFMMAGHAIPFGNFDLFVLFRRMAGGTTQAKIEGVAGVGEFHSLQGGFWRKFYPGLGMTEPGAIPPLDGALLGQRGRRLSGQVKETVHVPIGHLDKLGSIKGIMHSLADFHKVDVVPGILE
jgi:hypothetical protein